MLMKVRYERVPKDVPVLRPQVRRHSQEYLEGLADNLVDLGQLAPVGLLAKDFTVIWGNGRVIASRMRTQITHVLGAIFEEEVSKPDFLRMQFTDNHFQNPLSNAEKCLTALEYAQINPSMTNKQIAFDLGRVDPSLITVWLSWGKAIEPVRQALAAERITLQDMYGITKEPDQAAALAEKLAGRAARRRKGPAEDAAAVARVKLLKVPLASGAVVQISGAEITLGDCIEAAQDALKAMKKAQADGLDSRTAQAVFRDVAAKARA